MNDNRLAGTKTLLITGGTGSFGQTIIEHLLEKSCWNLRILSRDERKQELVRMRFESDRLSCYLGDVRDMESVNYAMRGVDYVFHAAALKQVPSCEFFPIEAVKTNVLGANNVMEAAIKNDVESVVVLSTDKAVYPINAMGLSKALMEKVMCSKAQLQNCQTRFSATRYGNVIASRGSVIPHFIKNIREGKPLTITNPLMTRFLMSLEESVDLVIKAFLDAKSGDLLVRKSPASTIAVLAEAVKHLMGVPEHPTKIIGTRHGEKLFESLLSREEMLKCRDLGDYFRVPIDGRTLDYGKYVVKGEKQSDEVDDYNSHNTERFTVLDTIDCLQKNQQVRTLLSNNDVTL